MSSDGRPPSSRPRIRKAHSAEQEYSGPVGSDSAPAQYTGGVHWYGGDGVLYYRGDDGTEYYLASDGAYYPRGLLAEALSSASGSSASFGSSGTGGSSALRGSSAADDRSTYYEYIARHSGELPAHPGSGSGRPQGHAGHAQGSPHAGPHSALAEAPAGYPPAPPMPSAPPFAPGAGSSLPTKPPHTEPVGSPGSAAVGHVAGSGPASGAAASAAPHATSAAAVAAGPGTDNGNGGTRPRRRWVPAAVGTVALLAVVALGVTLGFVFLGPDRGVQATDIETPATDPTDRTADDSPEASEGAPPPAEDLLNEHVADGTRIAHERLEGQWVVQLSAKKEDLEANGRTWDDEAILEEFEENQRRHPEAVLLWSGDWSSFRLGDFWVTVLAEPYDDPADALATCRNLGLDRDNCFAKKLSTSEGPDGTTELND